MKIYRNVILILVGLIILTIAYNMAYAQDPFDAPVLEELYIVPTYPTIADEIIMQSYVRANYLTFEQQVDSIIGNKIYVGASYDMSVINGPQPLTLYELSFGVLSEGTYDLIYKIDEIFYSQDYKELDNYDTIHYSSFKVYRDLSDVNTAKNNISTLILHRFSDVVVALFPTAGVGEAITLYDAAGRVVAVQPIRKGATTTSINVANLPKGVYIARLNSGASEKIAL